MSAPNWAKLHDHKNRITGREQIFVIMGVMRLHALQKCDNQKALNYTVQSICGVSFVVHTYKVTQNSTLLWWLWLDCCSPTAQAAVLNRFFIGYTKRKTLANCTNPLNRICWLKLVIATAKLFYSSQLWQISTGSISEFWVSNEDKKGRYVYFSVSVALVSCGLSNELKCNDDGPRVHTHWCTHAALHVLQDVSQQAAGKADYRQLLPHR